MGSCMGLNSPTSSKPNERRKKLGMKKESEKD
jgi:hypothetical protein